MKKAYYVDNISMLDIIQIEKKLYGLYRNAILDFEKRFSIYDCDIEVVYCWTTDNSGKATNTRPVLVNNYVYWICYVVLRNGKPVIYDNENSPLTRSYGSLVISKRHKHKFLVEVFEDTEDVKEELMEDLNRIRQM